MGPRPNKGFVGLKNAGATCYMNSVIQQLYMIPPIRNGILAIEGTGTDVDDDMSGDEKQENEVKVSIYRLCKVRETQWEPCIYNFISFFLPISSTTWFLVSYLSDVASKMYHCRCAVCSHFAICVSLPQSNVDPRDEVFSYHHQFDDKPSSKSEDRKEYNIGVLRHLQVIFGHLAASRLQYYVPRGFWKQFR